MLVAAERRSYKARDSDWPRFMSGAASVMSTGGRMGRTKTLALGLALLMIPAGALAQAVAPAPAAPAAAVPETAPGTIAPETAVAGTEAVAELKPTEGIGMPIPGAIHLQEQQTEGGHRSEERRGGQECVRPCRSRWGR